MLIGLKRRLEWKGLSHTLIKFVVVLAEGNFESLSLVITVYIECRLCEYVSCDRCKRRTIYHQLFRGGITDLKKYLCSFKKVLMAKTLASFRYARWMVLG